MIFTSVAFHDRILDKKGDKKKMYRKVVKFFAVVLMFFSMLLLIFEIMTGLLSQILCQKFCGETYTPSIEPRIVDLSCVFDTDRYLGFSLVLLLVLGIMLNVLSSRKTVAEVSQ